MFDHHRPARSQDKHDRRRDIEKVEPGATSSANVNHGTWQFRWIDHRIDGSFQEQTNELENFIRAFALAMQLGEKLHLRFVVGLI